MKKSSRVLLKKFEEEYQSSEDFREICVFYEKGYCKLDSKCLDGQFFSVRKEGLEDCDLYTLELDVGVLSARIDEVSSEIKSLIRNPRKNIDKLSDLALGLRVLEKILKNEFPGFKGGSHV